MSVQVIVRTSDGVATGWLRGTFRTVKPGTTVVTVPEAPADLTGVRWDGATGLRPATPAEQRAREDELAAPRLSDDAEALIAVLAPRLSVEPTTLRAEVQTARTGRGR